MARARIPAGGSGTISHQVRIDGRWLSESRVRADGITIPRGVERRARLPYRAADGTRGEVTVGGPTRGACETAARARLADIRAQEAEAARPRARGTLRRYVEQWIALLEAGELPRHYSARSVDTYRSIARRHALPATIADTPVDDLTRADLKRALRAVPAPAQRHVLVLWRHAWDLADDDMPNPPPSPLLSLRRAAAARASEPPRSRTRAAHDRDRVYSDDELAALLRRLDASTQAVSSGARDAIALALETGLRIGELTGLRWADIDLAATPPHLRVEGQIERRTGHPPTWVSVPKSALSRRTIPLTDAAVAVVRRREAMRMEREVGGEATEADRRYLFPTVRSHAIPDQAALGKSIRIALTAAGHPEMTTHSLRRVMERRLEAAGLPRMDRESIMGHTIRVAEAHYSTHGVPERAVAAMTREGAEVPAPSDSETPIS
ncbi:tyrosine-type recombinase/integrase [Brachybacterium alimentarium]|uniref:tyrosine-type recombinase/integrase n=1 Tax=Brachybacterium alimentarium TaxID=47845 RepID=UPI003FD4C754